MSPKELHEYVQQLNLSYWLFYGESMINCPIHGYVDDAWDGCKTCGQCIRGEK